MALDGVRRKYSEDDIVALAREITDAENGAAPRSDKSLFRELAHRTGLSESTLRRRLGVASDPNAAVRRLKSGHMTREQLARALRNYVASLPAPEVGMLAKAIEQLESYDQF